MGTVKTGPDAAPPPHKVGNGVVFDRSKALDQHKRVREATAKAVERAEQQLKDARFTHKYLAPLFNIGDALKPQPPIDWTIEGLAEAGGVLVVFGAPGTGKTYAATDLGMRVAMGKPWLGRKTKQCRVLWIDEDSGRKRLLRRLGDVARGHQADASTPFEVLSLAGVNILKEEDAAELQRLITERGAGLVVLDTLADVCGGAKIVSPDEMLPVLQSLRRIAETTGALILVLHHTNKGGEFLGAVTIAGKADLLLQLENSGTGLLTFTSQKARDSGALKFAAQMNFYTESNEFWLSEADVEGIDRAKRIATMGGAVKHVYGYLKENGSGSIEDMLDEAYTKAAIRQAIARLSDEKLIYRSNIGGRGQAGIYAIVKEASNDKL